MISIVGKRSLSVFLEKLCWFILFLGIALTAMLPWILDLYASRFWLNLGLGHYTRVLLVLYPSALMALTVVWQLRKILKNVNSGASFTRENAKRVVVVSGCCLVVGILFLVGIVPSFLAPLVGLVFLFLAALALVLSELVKQAAIYKDENDLTI